MIAFEIEVNSTSPTVGVAPANQVVVAALARPGPAGEPGPTGDPGPSGPAGTRWFFGHGPPSVVIGARAGDIYRDLDSGIEYRLD